MEESAKAGGTKFGAKDHWEAAVEKDGRAEMGREGAGRKDVEYCVREDASKGEDARWTVARGTAISGVVARTVAGGDSISGIISTDRGIVTGTHCLVPSFGPEIVGVVRIETMAVRELYASRHVASVMACKKPTDIRRGFVAVGGFT